MRAAYAWCPCIAMALGSFIHKSSRYRYFLIGPYSEKSSDGEYRTHDFET